MTRLFLFCCNNLTKLSENNCVDQIFKRMITVIKFPSNCAV